MRLGRALFALTALLATPAAAGAQFLQYDAARHEQDLVDVRPSLRLDAMGGLRLVVPDENNELNLSDFGGNLAGVLQDRNGWSVESWAGRSNEFSDLNTNYLRQDVRQRQRFDLERSGMDVVYRRPSRTALGFTLFWRGYDARQRYGDNSRVSGPDTRLFVVQKFGRATAAVGVSTGSDKEDLVSLDIFSIHHTSKTRRLTLAAGYDVAGMSVGGQLEADRVRIEGRSFDPAGFHGDEFDWRRPALRWRLTAVRPESVNPLAFGASIGRLSREGTEEAAISWSDRFPANPGHVNFVTHIPSFTETEKGWDAQGRVSLRLSPLLRIGGEAVYQKFSTNVHVAPNSNFVGSRTEEETDQKAWRVSGGLGTVLRGGRLRAGLEAGAEGGTIDSQRPRVTTNQESKTYLLRLGAEYLALGRVAVRAGYQRSSHDRDVGQPASLSISDGVTAGLGYAPRGGLVAIDTYVRAWQESPDVPGTLDRRSEKQDLGVSVRLLF